MQLPSRFHYPHDDAIHHRPSVFDHPLHCLKPLVVRILLGHICGNPDLILPIREASIEFEDDCLLELLALFAKGEECTA